MKLNVLLWFLNGTSLIKQVYGMDVLFCITYTQVANSKPKI